MHALCPGHSCHLFAGGATSLRFRGIAGHPCAAARPLSHRNGMSWQQHLDRLLQTGKVKDGAIHGHDGSCWCTSRDFKVPLARHALTRAGR